MRLDVQTLKQSFADAMERRPDLGERFVARLAATHPELEGEIRSMGGSAGTVVTELLRVVLRRMQEPHWVEVRLLSLGAQHPSDEDARTFEVIFATLVDVVRDAAQPLWSGHTETAWRRAQEHFVQLVRTGARAARSVTDDQHPAVSIHAS